MLWTDRYQFFQSRISFHVKILYVHKLLLVRETSELLSVADYSTGKPASDSRKSVQCRRIGQVQVKQRNVDIWLQPAKDAVRYDVGFGKIRLFLEPSSFFPVIVY